MRTAKKLLAMILTVSMIFSMVTVTTFAADQTSESAGVRIAEKSYDSANQILTMNVQVKLPSATGITSAGILLSYDSSVLTLMHKTKNETTYTPTAVKSTYKTAVNCLLESDQEESYTIVNADLYGNNGRAGFFVGMGTTDGPSDSQKTTDWMTIFELRFKVNGDAASVLNSDSIRIADPVKDSDVVQGSYGSNDFYTASVEDAGATPSKFYHGKMTGNSTEVSGTNYLMNAEGNASATYTGSTNQPPKAAYSGAAATISDVAKVGENVVVTAAVPNGETAEYGYSTTNDAAAVANWQDSNTFAAPAAGTYYFFARVKENAEHLAGGASTGYSFTVYGPLSLSYTAPASMTIGTAISVMTPSVGGGSGSYSYAVTSGSLPTGLSLNASTGVISGTPTAASAASSVTVTVTDSASNTKDAVINFPEVEKKTNTVTFTAPKNEFVVGQPVSFTATATNGSPNYSYQKNGEDSWSNVAPTEVGNYKVKAAVAESEQYKVGEAIHSFSIVPKAVTSITVTAPTKTTYVVGQELDKTGMAITAYYNDGTNAPVGVGSAVITGFDSSAPADSQTITVSYGGRSDTFTVKIEAKTLQSLAITTNPDKVSGYKAFETLDATGMVVTATYNSGAEVVAAGQYTISYANGDSFRAGDTKAVVNFGGKTADVTVSSVGKATLDVSGVSWTGADSVPYDGQAHSVTLTGLPAGLTVTGYTNNEKTYVGTYTAVATLSYDSANYELSDSIANKNWSITAVNQTPAITATANVTKGGNTLDLKTLVSNAQGTVSFEISGNANGCSISNGILTSGADTGTVKITVNITAKDMNSDSTAEYNVYTGTEAITVTIMNKQSASLSVFQTGCTYGETLAAPTYNEPANTTSTVITYNGTLDKGGTYSDTTAPTEAGTYIVNVKCETATHIYEGTSASFTIAPKNISGMTVTLSADSKEYTGSAQSISVTGVTGLDVSDYDVSGVTSGTNVGQYTVTVTGKGNYTGTAEKTWKITPKALTISAATATNRSYVKDDKSVVISGVTFTGATLTKDTDYTVTGVMNDANAGTGKTVNVTVVLTNSNYSLATATTTTTVDIEKASAQTLADIVDSFKYTVTSGEKAIGTAGMPADAGTLTYTKGAVSKTGSVTVDSWSVDANGKVAYTLSGGAENDTITLPVTIQSTNYADSLVNVKLTLTAKDGQAALNITSGTTVVYGSTLNLTVSGGSGTGAVTYAVTNGTGEATTNGNVLTATKAGEVTVVATKAGDNDYNAVSSTAVTITISKATPTGTPGYTKITTSGKTLGDAALTIGTITPTGGTIAWDLGDAQTVSANTSYNWTYTPADTTNYNVLTGSIKPYVVSSGGGGGYVSTYAITVENAKNGTVSISPKSASKGSTVTVTVAPDKGYTLETLTVTDKNGKEIELTNKGNGKYTFKMPASKVTVKATFMDDNTMLNFFVDVPADAYYYDAVLWAVKEGITNGTSATTFSPDNPCTRAQMATFLWRAAGSPDPKSTACDFTDVDMSSYYGKAVLWAVEIGIINGTSATTFSPNNPCTRAHMATILFRLEDGKAEGTENMFTDVKPDAYYAEAVQWAVEQTITNGMTATTFGPNEVCTRAHMATFMYRYFVK